MQKPDARNFYFFLKIKIFERIKKTCLYKNIIV